MYSMYISYNDWLMCLKVMNARVIQATVGKFEKLNRLLVAEGLIWEDMFLGATLRAMYSR